MSTAFFQTPLSPMEQTDRMLQELRIPVHRIGYRHLALGIPHYREQNMQSLSKELYPWLSRQFGRISPQAIEHATRESIRYGWEHRTPEVWDLYFPGAVKPPSNKQFIAALARRIW